MLEATLETHQQRLDELHDVDENVARLDTRLRRIEKAIDILNEDRYDAGTGMLPVTPRKERTI
jgi:hypothetical protein